MRIFKITNIETGKVFYVKNKSEFSKDNDLTLRLLNYTQTGQRTHHKNFRVEDILFFTPNSNGNIKLWGYEITGFINKEENNIHVNPKETIINHVTHNGEKQESYTEIDVSDYIKEIQKLRKSLQRTRDNLNVNRKETRQELRYEIFLEDMQSELGDLLRINVPSIRVKNNNYYSNEIAILQLSDLHFGQKVDLSDNQFNIEIARERLKTYFSKCIEEIERRNIKEVHIALVGDLIHSASMLTKPDMKLASEYNEVEASVMCYRALAENIDLLVKDYYIKFSGIVGNESRFSNHMRHTNLDSEASNSMDYMIYAFLQERYAKLDNVEFINDGKTLESVIDVGNRKFGLIHGDKSLNHSSLNRSIWNLKGRLSQTFGHIDYVLLGHIHETYISNEFARNSSLVGSNSYSVAIGIPFSTPAQNLIIVSDDDIKAMSITVE